MTLVPGCNTDSTPNWTKGTVAGESFQVVEAVFAICDYPDTGSEQGLAVMLVDRSGLCETLREKGALRDAGVLHMVFSEQVDGAQIMPTVGSYVEHLGLATNPSEKWVSASYSQWDSECRSTTEQQAALPDHGSARLDAISLRSAVHGSFDLTFRSGDRLEGGFEAIYCDGYLDPSKTCP